MTRGAPLILSLALAVGASACVDDPGAFYVSRALLAAKGCTAPAASATTGSYLGSGTLDLSLKQGYLLFPQIENHMVSSAKTQGVETNLIAMREIRVKIDLGNIPGSYPADLLTFSEPTSGTIEPGGKLVTSVEVIPTALAALLAPVVRAPQTPNVIAEIRAMGVRTGSEMETAPFPFPIRLCNGCLVDLRPTCPDPKDTTISTNHCGPQDSPVTCCPGAQGAIVCLQPGT